MKPVSDRKASNGSCKLLTAACISVGAGACIESVKLVPFGRSS